MPCWRRKCVHTGSLPAAIFPHPVPCSALLTVDILEETQQKGLGECYGKHQRLSREDQVQGL